MKTILSLFISFCFTGAFAQTPSAVPYGNNPQAGNYKHINGIKLYYEVYGNGKPLILLHGNGGQIRSQGKRIAYFSQSFKVIAVDSRGHGKSLDDQPLTYEQMADDISDLMDSLQIDSANIWGQSDGGILGLLIAIRHPEKVSSLATFGANLFPGKEAVYDEADKWVTDSLKATKDPKTKQLFSLLVYQPDIKDEELKKIKCPVLIMSGDRDFIRLEHSIRIFNQIENSNLFVMPGATHFGAYQKPELFNMILMDFFTKPFSKMSTMDAVLGRH